MSDEKKIIVDEDWKSQVAAEKEELKREQSSAKAPENPATTPPSALPEASFALLITSFATEAMVALGQLPNPITQKMETNLDQARYVIDMLQMLQEKTQGNLTAEEETALEDLLHQLRLAFVAVQAAPRKE